MNERASVRLSVCGCVRASAHIMQRWLDLGGCVCAHVRLCVRVLAPACTIRHKDTYACQRAHMCFAEIPVFSRNALAQTPSGFCFTPPVSAK